MSSVPTFPAPVDVPLPAWAAGGDEWEWDLDHWQRCVWRDLGFDPVDLAAMQYCRVAGLVTMEPSLGLDGNYSFDDPDDLRAFARSILASADALEAAQVVSR